MTGRLAVVGIGEDGWAGLGEPARRLLVDARLVLGAERQLAMLPPEVAAERETWPSPMRPRIRSLAEQVQGGDGAGIAVLASGDPMLHGVGSSLAALTGPGLLHVLPAPSAFSLACARLGWAAHETPLLSLVADPDAPLDIPSGRAVVYVPGAGGAALLARRLTEQGQGAARLTVLAHLGGPSESIEPATTAAGLTGDRPQLHLVAVEMPGGPQDEPARSTEVRSTSTAAVQQTGARPEDAAGPGGSSGKDVGGRRGRLTSSTPGLPDDLFEGDGQLTRDTVRAVALAMLAPRAGELLWDLGSGSGTIAAEWLRAAPGMRAHAVERRTDRLRTTVENVLRLAPGAELSTALADLSDLTSAVPEGGQDPDAIFIGGGLTAPGLTSGCWEALAPGGRLVATAVTLEGEALLAAEHERRGGRLLRLEHAAAAPLGGFRGWKPERPVVLWAAEKEESDAS